MTYNVTCRQSVLFFRIYEMHVPYLMKHWIWSSNKNRCIPSTHAEDHIFPTVVFRLEIYRIKIFDSQLTRKQPSHRTFFCIVPGLICSLAVYKSSLGARWLATCSDTEHPLAIPTWILKANTGKRPWWWKNATSCGVQRLIYSLLDTAPASLRFSRVSIDPLLAAQCNEVQPSRSMRLGSKPFLRSQAVVLAEPLDAPWWRQLRPCLSVIVRPGPASDKNLMVTRLPPAQARWSAVLHWWSLELKSATIVKSN